MDEMVKASPLIEEAVALMEGDSVAEGDRLFVLVRVLRQDLSPDDVVYTMGLLDRQVGFDGDVLSAVSADGYQPEDKESVERALSILLATVDVGKSDRENFVVSLIQNTMSFPSDEVRGEVVGGQNSLVRLTYAEPIVEAG